MRIEFVDTAATSTYRSRRDWYSVIADERATTAHHGFPGFKQISRIRSVRAHNSSPTSPDDLFFVNHLGKLTGAVTKSIARARGTRRRRR